MKNVLTIFIMLFYEVLTAQTVYIGPINSIGSGRAGSGPENVPLFPIVGISLTSGNVYAMIKRKKSEDLIGVSFLIGPAQLFYSSQLKHTTGLNSKAINGFIGFGTLLSASVKFVIDQKRKNKTKHKTSEYGKRQNE